MFLIIFVASKDECLHIVQEFFKRVQTTLWLESSGICSSFFAIIYRYYGCDMAAAQNVRFRSIPRYHMRSISHDPYQNAGDPDRSIRPDHPRNDPYPFFEPYPYRDISYIICIYPYYIDIYITSITHFDIMYRCDIDRCIFLAANRFMDVGGKPFHFWEPKNKQWLDDAGCSFIPENIAI